MPNYLRSWVANRKQGLPVLFFIILLSAISQFATFALSQNFVISSFGAQPEDISFALQMAYVGILVTLPIHFRLIRYFELRNYLVVAITLGILLSIVCINTSDLLLFFVFRLLQGMVVCTISASILMMFSIYLKAEHKQVVAPSIFYGTILSSGVLIGLVFANVSLNTDWKEVYQYLIALQVFSLLLVVVIFNPKSGVKPYPLYQIDWIAAVFFLTAAISLAYTFIYGSKYYWFTDSRIQLSFCLTVFMILLYISRLTTQKRPLISLQVFRYRKFWAGLLLLALYYGIKESINLIFGYTTAILQWNATQMMTLGLFNIAGVLIFIVIAGKLIIDKKVTIPVLLVAGFTVLLTYHVWMYQIFTPDLSFQDLIVPVFLQGAASGLIFVPIMLFTLSSVPPSTGMTGLIVAAYVRFISLLNVSAGFYNLQLYYNQFFKERFLTHVTLLDNPAAERLAGYKQVFLAKGMSSGQAESLAQLNLSKVLSIQSQLLSNRAIFLLMSYLMVVILVVLVMLVMNARLGRKKA